MEAVKNEAKQKNRCLEKAQPAPFDAENREHDACGIGMIVNIDGHQDRRTLDDALSIVEKLEHRAGKDASGKVGDGVGILTQISDSFRVSTVSP